MCVFILMVNVKPETSHPLFGEIAGAYANCYILSESLESAEETALKFLEQEGWIPIRLEDNWEVTEDDYAHDKDGLEIYRQVLIDREVFRIHTYDEEED
jgi:hypothetical protein